MCDIISQISESEIGLDVNPGSNMRTNISFNVWANPSVLNFKETFRNLAQIILPMHQKICVYSKVIL